MKKLLFLLVIVISCAVVANYGRTLFRSKIESALSVQPETSQLNSNPTPTAPAAKIINETLFVPYWSMNSDFSVPNYKNLVYFGVKATTKGVDTSDAGYDNISDFSQAASTEHTILAVRMIDNTTNFAILKDTSSQEKLITESIQLAAKYHFKGILLDLEITALPFSSLVDQITTFNALFAKNTHAADLSYSITAYGDSFYRVRPFDVSNMAKVADNVYIMAYDFDKANGNPGPNFPLGGSETYGYDYTHMIDNFADAVPLNKLIVTFGMYGYDWVVGDNDKAKETGTSISLKNIEASIISNCHYLSCEWERDITSSETKATYTDQVNEKHIVWFEDEESVKRKQDFLKKRGIGSYAYWAYSYF